MELYIIIMVNSSVAKIITGNYNEIDKLEFIGEIMIVLITGASHTGKTALAQKLLENIIRSGK